ncbi:MAG TPA: hypothetical protein VFQ00_10560 [Terriglobales bacterium]|nr:hypothetical protein [Terriglobales bacterium]
MAEATIQGESALPRGLKASLLRINAEAPTSKSQGAPAAYLSSRLNGHGGMILLDAQGRFGIAHHTPRMAWGWTTKGKEAAGTEIVASAK